MRVILGSLVMLLISNLFVVSSAKADETACARVASIEGGNASSNDPAAIVNFKDGTPNEFYYWKRVPLTSFAGTSMVTLLTHAYSSKEMVKVYMDTGNNITYVKLHDTTCPGVALIKTGNLPGINQEN